MYKIIPVAGPSVTDKEVSYVNDAIINGWYSKSNDYVEMFESKFKKFHGRNFAISLPSCTSAIHLSLLALGVKKGDEVIVPDMTWIASAAPINYVGATPIFADIEKKTLCLSARTIAPLITKKTKAIISVNLYGHMPDYDKIIKLGIPIIEDSAESLGSKYKKKLAGTFGITSCFSFHGSKTLTTGEGGMLLTDDEKIFSECMILRDHGRNPGDTLFQNIKVGFKYKMSNIQAAMGLAQTERINELVNKKRKIFNLYKKAFENIKNVELNPKCRFTYNSYWMSSLIFGEKIKLSKFELINNLKKYGIQTRPFFCPLSSLKAYKNAQDQSRASQINKNSYFISKRGINLPSPLNLTQKDVVKVKNTLNKILN